MARSTTAAGDPISFFGPGIRGDVAAAFSTLGKGCCGRVTLGGDWGCTSASGLGHGVTVIRNASLAG